MVGNSTWQTLENADVTALNATMLNAPSFKILLDRTSKSASGGVDLSGGVAMKAYVPLPIFTSGGPSRAHLTAGCPTPVIQNQAIIRWCR